MPSASAYPGVQRRTQEPRGDEMLERSARRLQLLLVAVTFLIAIGVQALLPPGALIPTHFNAQGEADGWSSASAVLMHIPEFLVVALVARQLFARVWPSRF